MGNKKSKDKQNIKKVSLDKSIIRSMSFKQACKLPIV